MPQKYAIIDDDIAKKLEIRKLLIKNYIAFYRINEKEKNSRSSQNFIWCIKLDIQVIMNNKVYLRVIIFICCYSYFDMQEFFNY